MESFYSVGQRRMLSKHTLIKVHGILNILHCVANANAGG